jgi:hypothetical protein
MCTICPAGFYCPKQDLSPIACPNGWQSDVGMTYCNRCPVGFDCSRGVTSTTAPLPVATVNIARHNVVCPNGYYWNWLYTYGVNCMSYDTTGLDGGGTKCATPAASNTAYCIACPAGSFCPVQIAGDMTITQGLPNSVLPCQPGTWSKTMATRCILAEPGYSPTPITGATLRTGQVICPTTSYSYGGNDVCDTCPQGHECNFRKSAVPCPIFFWSAGGGAGATGQDCSPCPAGQDCQNLKLNKLSPSWSQQSTVPTT